MRTTNTERKGAHDGSENKEEPSFNPVKDDWWIGLGSDVGVVFEEDGKDQPHWVNYENDQETVAERITFGEVRQPCLAEWRPERPRRLYS